MDFKLAYVLTSSETDTYLEQTLLSMYSAKYYMPDAHITLITDDTTAASLTGNRKNILLYTDKHITVPLDKKYSQKVRSRLLKTNLRSLISGDFLFIDSDTVVCGDLSELTGIVQAPVSAVYDLHTLLANHPKKNDTITDLRTVNAHPDMTRGYFNSGVLFVKDTSEAYAFFTEWNKQYIRYSSVITQDQPSLELAREMYPEAINLLPDIYNTQILYTVRYIRHMKIMHYFATLPKEGYENSYICTFCDPRIVTAIKQTGIIPQEAVNLIAAPEQSLLQTALIFPPTLLFTSYLFRFTEKIFQYRNKNIILTALTKACAAVIQLLRRIKHLQWTRLK